MASNTLFYELIDFHLLHERKKKKKGKRWTWQVKFGEKILNCLCDGTQNIVLIFLIFSKL